MKKYKHFSSIRQYWTESERLQSCALSYSFKQNPTVINNSELKKIIKFCSISFIALMSNFSFILATYFELLFSNMSPGGLFKEGVEH
jgi:hypothetical protein